MKGTTRAAVAAVCRGRAYMAVPGLRLNHPGATSFVQLEGLYGDDKLHGLPAFPCASIPHARVEPPPSAMNPSAGTNQDSCHSLRGGRVFEIHEYFFGFRQRLRGLCPFLGDLCVKKCARSQSPAPRRATSTVLGPPHQHLLAAAVSGAPSRCSGEEPCDTLRQMGVKSATACLSVIGVKLSQGGGRSRSHNLH
jgi:hypothetical protein